MSLPFIIMTGIGILCVLLVLYKNAKDERKRNLREDIMDKKMREAESLFASKLVRKKPEPQRTPENRFSLIDLEDEHESR